MFKGIELADFNKFFQTEDDCKQYLFDLKWKEGYMCRRCGNLKFCKGRTRFHARCCNCKYDESVTAHTLFHRLQFSLMKAFSIAFQVAVVKKGISSVELSTLFGVNQKTAWLFKRRLQEAMATGLLNDDDIFVERVYRKVDSIILMRRPEDLNGLQSVQLELYHSKKNNSSVEHFRCLRSPLSVSFLPCDLIAGHYVDERKDIRIWNFKSWLTGVHHHCSEKFLQGYLDEFFYKYSYRNKRNVIWHNLISNVIRSKPY